MAELLRYTQEWHQQQQGIHPSDYIEEAAEHNDIAELSSSLLALFKEIVLALSKQTRIPRDARISIERSCSALILWSDGFGIAQGRLNSTFNKSRKLRYTALKNLLHIGRVLVERLVPAVDISSEKLQTLCSSAELNIEVAAGLIAEESCRQSDDSSSDAASTFSDDDIYEIAEDLKTDTLVLSGLDPLLKYPIFDSQHEYIIDSHALPTWGPEKSYSDKIENRFPRADVSLTLYLGRANYERFLRCQETRESQEEEEPLAIVNQEEGTHEGTIIANTKFHDSGVGTSIGLTMSYAETTMSYNHDGQSVRIPPLPKEAKAGSPFTCIACGRTVVITNNSAWKQHIYLDLQPYMCLDLSCPYSSSTFESRDNWISHLTLDHEMGPKWASTECPLCREETGNGKIAITKHFSKHLEEISLSALPVEVDPDAESENSPESSDASSSCNEGTHGGMDENRETLSVEFEAELASTVFSNLKDRLKAERNYKAQSEAAGAALQRTAEILAAAEAENMAVQLKRTQENIEEMFKKKEYASKMAELSPIKFTDAVGREFNFPVHLCYTWQGIKDLIEQAFSQVDVLGPHVQQGYYDLTDPDGRIIFPFVWEEAVEPGLHVTMTMWPLHKAPLASLGPKESEQPYEEEGNSEKSNSLQNNISSEITQQQRGAQHSQNVQGARIIRMSGQNFFSTAKAYFKDQPDKFTRFRVILADIATTEWVPEAWRRSCFECRVAEIECDAKAPDPCTRCRLNKLSCAVQFAAVSRQHTVGNGDQIRQGIINIGRLCEGYPSFMHELNSVMPTGYRVEVIDASTVRFFAPGNEPTILQVGMPKHLATGLDNQAGPDMGSNQQGKSMSEAPNRPTFANQNNSEAAMMQQQETCSQQPFQAHRQNMSIADQKPTLAHYFAQPTEPRLTADHPVTDTTHTPVLAYAELNKAAVSAHIRSQSVPLSHAVDEAKSLKFGTWGLDSKGVSEDWDEEFEFGDSANRNDGAVESYVDKIEQRFIGNPHISNQLLEALRDTQNGTRSTKNAYKELLSLNSALKEELGNLMAGGELKYDEALMQTFQNTKYVTTFNGETVETKEDNVRMHEVVATVKDKNGPNGPNEPQYCLCNKGSAGIMIRCDNVDSCKHKWFHMECVGLTVAPSSKEKWYCPNCRGHVNIGEKAELNLQRLPPDPRNSESANDTKDTRANLTYLESLAKFHKQQGNNLNRLPYVDKKPVELYRLKQLVESRGGFDKVCESKEWAEIAKDLGYSGKIMSSLSTSLKNTFLRWLSPYEEYLRLAKPGVRQQLEEEHVDPGNKEKIPSIGRINYPSPNPDIYIWPPESNVSGKKESEPAQSSTMPPPLPPPLPPPVMATSNPITDHEKGCNDPELSPPTDTREISDREHPSHEPFLASPRSSLYSRQLPPIADVVDDGNSAVVNRFDEVSGLRTSRTNPPLPFAPPVSNRLRRELNRNLPCEAEPLENKRCFKLFEDGKERRRHYLIFHKKFAEEQNIPDSKCVCNICGMRFGRRDNLRRHVNNVHLNASEEAPSSGPPVSKSTLYMNDLVNIDDSSQLGAIREEQIPHQQRVQALSAHQRQNMGAPGVGEIPIGPQLRFQQTQQFSLQKHGVQQQNSGVGTSESTNEVPTNVPLQSRDASTDDPLAEGGVLWYLGTLEPHDPSIPEEHWAAGRDAERTPSEKLTDIDDEEFKDLGVDMDNIVAAAKMVTREPRDALSTGSTENKTASRNMTDQSASKPPRIKKRILKISRPSDERDRGGKHELFGPEVEARAAQESAAQDKNTSSPPIAP